MKINPYLNFDGKAEEAFNFYRSIFGGDFLGPVNRMRDAPDGDKLPADEQNRVMHVALPIGDGVTLMASDTIPSMGHTLKEGNNVYVCINPDSKDEADRLFNGLSAGGHIEMPIQDMFWGDYYGSFKDKFGVQWMINFSQVHS